MSRGGKIVLIVIGSVAAAIGLGVGVMNSPRVQRALIDCVTQVVEEQLQTHVSIEAVHYHFPVRCAVHGVYIADQQGDTLLYADRLYAHLSPTALCHQRVLLWRVDMEHIRVHAYRMADSVYNYTFLMKEKEEKDSLQLPMAWGIEAKRIEIRDIQVHYDTLNIRLHSVSCAYCGDSTSMEVGIKDGQGDFRIDGHKEVLALSDLDLEMVYLDTVLCLPTLRVRLAHSELDASGIRLDYPHKLSEISKKEYLQTEAGKIGLHLQLNEFTLVPSDLRALIPALDQLDDAIRMRGQIDGTLDSLDVRDWILYYGNERVFTGNCSAVGMPDWDEMVLRAECEDLSLKVDKVERLVSNLTHRPCVLPMEIHRLGNIHYRGVASGRLDRFQLDGAFKTQLGTVTTHGTCVSDSDFQSCVIRSEVGVRRFQLGRMLANNDIGIISTELNTELHLSTSRPAWGELGMKISDFSFRDYAYEQLEVEGRFDDRKIEVGVKMDDKNLALSLQATGNWNVDTMPYIRARLDLDHCYPGALRWSEGRLKESGWSMQVQLDQSYSENRRMIGLVTIDSVAITNGNRSINLDRIGMRLEDNGNYQKFRIDGGLVDGVMTGRFDFGQFKDMILKQMVRYVPSLFTEKEVNRISTLETDMRFDYRLLAHHIHALEEVLDLPVMVSDNLVITGYYNDVEDQWGLESHVPCVAAGKAELHDLSLALDNRDEKIRVRLQVELDSSQWVLGLSAHADSVELGLHIDALPPYNNHGDFRVSTYVTHYAGLPLVEAEIKPSTIQLGDSVYHVEQSHITYTMADSCLVFDGVRFRGHSQYIEIDGIASLNAEDSLSVRLSHINLGLIMPYLLPAQTLTVAGYASGWANVYSLFRAPMFEANMRIDSTVFNGSDWGTVHGQVALDKQTKHILINGDVHYRGHETAKVAGEVIPQEQRFELNVATDSIPLSFIEHWTHGFLRSIKGTVSGDVKICGLGKKTWVLTRAKPNDVSLLIPFTGCRYWVNDTIIMDSTSIQFPQLKLHDSEGNPLAFDGILTHNAYFRDFVLDLHARCEHTLALDIPHSHGQMMEGKVYATGTVDITGPDNDIQLQANAMAVGKSRFQLSLGTSSSARDNSFVTFVDHTKDKAKKDTTSHFIPQRKNPLFAKGASRFRLGLNIDIDPQTLFQLVIDERTGDMIEARGDGSIKFSLDDATDDIQLVGTYTIASGKMGFTIGNLIRRDFTIENGSQIIWNGKAEEPLLDVTAKYQVTASLKDLFGSETEQLVSGRTTVPVATKIHLSGPLDDPIIRFGIELPKSEENIENQVKAIINTDEMMMREVVYLLVFGKFFTPEYVKTSGAATTLNSTYALLSSTITGQINSWLGKLTNVFTLGFNIRSEGTDQKSAQEYEAVFQLQPVDRLIINGNFGYRYNDISNRPFFGDLDIECLLTPNGKYRLKGYTHTVDKYSLKQASTIQGVGFLFRHDFNWRRTEEEKRLREAQKEAEKAAKAAEKSRKQATKQQQKEEK